MRRKIIRGLALTVLIDPALALVGSNVLARVRRGRLARTMGDLQTLSTGIEAWAMDNKKYPLANATLRDAGDLLPFVKPIYLKEPPLKDGWGNGFHVWSDGDDYVLISYGADGKPDRDYTQIKTFKDVPVPGDLTAEKNDIILGDGQFRSWPEGSCH
jgi:hypothetical protein